MTKLFIIIVASFFSFLSGCAHISPENSEISAVDKALKSLELPATFSGEIPCSDCLGVDIALNLRPDSIYQLRKTYRNKGGSQKVDSQLGKWRLAEDGKFIILGKKKGSLKSYTLISADQLKFIGIESVDDSSQIAYDLFRQQELDPFPDSVKLRGKLGYSTKETLFTECKSGVSFPVTGGAELRRMVQNYLNIPHAYAEPLLVSIRGQLQTPNTMSSEGTEQIMVEQFTRFYPDRDCDGKKIRESFTGTIWRLIELDSQPVSLMKNEQRPYFLLNSKDKRLKGFGSCNSISGSYLVKGEVFLIKRLISTRMACPNGVEMETAFVRALDATETFRLESDTLKLLDSEERIIAVLKADA